MCQQQYGPLARHNDVKRSERRAWMSLIPALFAWRRSVPGRIMSLFAGEVEERGQDILYLVRYEQPHPKTR